MLYRNLGPVTIPARFCKILKMEATTLDLEYHHPAVKGDQYQAVDAICDAPVVLKALSPHQRYIAELRYKEEATAAEIAEIINTTRTNVNTILRNIRKKYAEYGISPCEHCKWHKLCEMHNIKVCKVKDLYLDAEAS